MMTPGYCFLNAESNHRLVISEGQA